MGIFTRKKTSSTDTIRFKESTCNYKKDLVLESLLSKALDSGIKSIRYEHCKIFIEFNIVNATLWNANKPHSWLMEGQIGKFMWHNSRPSIETMNKLHEEITKYHLDNLEELYQ